MLENKKVLSRRDFLKIGGASATAFAAGPLFHTSRARAQGRTQLVYIWPFAAAQAVQQEIVNRFNEQSSTIEVELQIVPQDSVLPALTTAFSSGAGPDVLAMSPAWLTQFAAGGFLQNLEEPLASSELEETLLPVAMLQGRMYQNTAYMIGSVVDTYPLFYNTKHFEEAGLSGPPTTTEEFHDYAVRLTDVANNRYGYYQLAANPWAFQSWSTWMLNHGGIGVDNTLYDEDGKSVFRQPDQIVGLEAWADLYREAQVSPPASAAGSFNDAANAFNAGQVSMVMGFLGYIRNFAGGIGSDSFSTAITPAGPVGQYVHYAANGFCVGSQSPNQEAAWEFVQYLMTPEVNGLLNQEWGAIPSVVEALDFEYLEDPVFEAPLQMVQMNEAFVHTPRQYPEWARFFQEYGPEQGQALLLGAQSTEDFANNVSESLEAMWAANEGE